MMGKTHSIACSGVKYRLRPTSFRTSALSRPAWSMSLCRAHQKEGPSWCDGINHSLRQGNATGMHVTLERPVPQHQVI